jgi:hypothetical protein
LHLLGHGSLVLLSVVYTVFPSYLNFHPPIPKCFL